MTRVVAIILLVAAGCGEPERVSPARPTVPPPPKPRVEARLPPKDDTPAPTRIKRDLLFRYGDQLTAQQRSALQGASIGTYEQGEDMCKRWIAENKRFGEDR